MNTHGDRYPGGPLYKVLAVLISLLIWVVVILTARAVSGEELELSESEACIRSMTAGLVMPPGEVLLEQCEYPNTQTIAEECATLTAPPITAEMMAQCSMSIQRATAKAPEPRWPSDIGGCRYYLPPVNAIGSEAAYLTWWTNTTGSRSVYPLRCGPVRKGRQTITRCPGLNPWVLSKAEVWREVTHASGKRIRFAGNLYRVVEPGPATIRWGVTNQDTGATVVSGSYPFDFPCSLQTGNLPWSDGFESGSFRDWAKVVKQ